MVDRQRVYEHCASEAAVCPCCGQPLTVQVDVRQTADGHLTLNAFRLAHAASAAGTAIRAQVDRLRDTN